MAQVNMHKKKFQGIIIKILANLILVLIEFADVSSGQWLNHGNGLSNTRNGVGEVLINPITARNLRLRWRFIAGKDISATPAVANGVVYFPSWNGFLYAVNAFSGALIWEQNLSQLTGLRGTGVTVNVTVSRSTPTVVANLLIVGIYGPAVVISVERATGRLVWLTTLEDSPFRIITMSGTAYMGSFYVGVSSLEEVTQSAQCCTFRGSLARLDIRTGAVIWRTYTIPNNGDRLGGYSGAAIWGSSPAIDVYRQLVYVGTGQLYSAPPEVLKCQQLRNNQSTKPIRPEQCIGPDVHYDSILGLDILTGRIVWSRQLGGYDVFYFACLVPNNPDCPPGPNLDADFGEAPMLLRIYPNGSTRGPRDVVVAVQKSGFAWALDRDSGDIVWSKLAGPGGKEGGGTWGAATDGRRVYTNIVNSDRVKFTLAPSNAATTAGGWVALDANNGQIIWSTPNPSNETANGPVSVANGVVFAGSVASNGPIYAMDAYSGRIIWSYDTGATVYGGMAVSYGCIFVGHGYKVSLANFHPTWSSGTSLFAFCVY